MAQNRDKRNEMAQQDDLEEHNVFVNHCAKTVKGGRRMSFSAVIVVGDKEGKVGVGFGKANEVSDAIRKGGEAARKNMRKVTLKGKTIPHEVEGVCDGGRVLLKPAPDGTGLIVGGGMRPVLEAVGIRDAVGKSLGSKNRLNVVKATMNALLKLRSAEEIAMSRGKCREIAAILSLSGVVASLANTARTNLEPEDASPGMPKFPSPLECPSELSSPEMI